jgi:Uma2 family endonuclease
MQWADVLNDPTLKNLPYKIELNERGQIVMTPISNKHGLLQSRIARALGNQLNQGEVITEASIKTDKGVKVADVAWISDQFVQEHGFETPFTAAPEICVEILSPSNSQEEMQEKRTLYLEGGAQEVWIVSEAGVVQLYDGNGLIQKSRYGVTLEGILLSV